MLCFVPVIVHPCKRDPSTVSCRRPMKYVAPSVYFMQYACQPKPVLWIFDASANDDCDADTLRKWLAGKDSVIMHEVVDIGDSVFHLFGPLRWGMEDDGLQSRLLVPGFRGYNQIATLTFPLDNCGSERIDGPP